MNGHVDDRLHQPFAVLSVFSTRRRGNILKLGSSSVGIDTSTEKILNEKSLIRDCNGE